MKRILVGGLAVLLSVSSSARAWNNVGHMTVAQIAWTLLSPDEKAKATEILKNTPFYDKLLQENLSSGEDPAEWAFLKAATFPDEVRASRPGDKVFKDRTITQYDHPKWHYVDLPFDFYGDVEDGPSKPPTTMSSAEMIASMAASTRPTAKPATRPFEHKVDEEDLFTAYKAQYAKVLDPNTKPMDRAIALCWVEHLVGDIHQPLHATSEFSRRFPRGDAGGNSQIVKAEGKEINLHSLWDENLGAAAEWSVKEFPDAFSIHFLSKQISADPKFDVSRDGDYAAHKTIEEWGAESEQYAVTFAYVGGSLKSDVFKYPPKGQPVPPLKDPDAPALPGGYIENMRLVSMLRVAEAGHRLADVLHAALAAK